MNHSESSIPAILPWPARIRWLVLRLLAAVYDGLVLVALFIVATAVLMPFTGGAIDPPLPYNLPFDLYILAIGFGFFGLFWTRGGQTIGMRAWRLRVVDLNGEALTWHKALRRYLAGLFSWMTLGAGWLWIVFDRRGMALHDHLSGSHIVRVPKQKRVQ